MKIDIITGCFNQRLQLLTLYESLVAQKEHINSWIICDDGSHDGTWNVIRGLTDESPFLIQGFSQTHDGMRLARNLNNGIRHATGDLLFFVMGDSYLQPSTLKELSNTYFEGSAGCGVRVNVDEQGKQLGIDWRMEQDIKEPIHGLSHLQMTGNSMIVRREDLLKVGMWDEGYEGYGRDDYDLFYRLEKAGIPLICYGNVRINHTYHGEGQDDNPANIVRFEKRKRGEL